MSPERRRDHLVAVALELYARMPPEQVTVDDVSRAADVSRALFYRYFPNLPSLHVAALSTIVDELIDRISRPVGGTPAEQLRETLEAFLGTVERHALAYVALLRSGSVVATRETEALVDAVRHRIVDLLVERSGIDQPGPLYLMTLRGWVALTEGALLTWLQDRPVSREQLVSWLIDQLAAMVAAAPLT
jgi:AcrR family transcriptional regulator